MTIQKRLTIYVVTLLFACGAIIIGTIYLIMPLYLDISHHASELAQLQTLALIIIVSGALIIVSALICAVLMAVYITRSVVPPIKMLGKLAKEIREGNLDSRVDYNQSDEFQLVFHEIDAMRERLKNSLIENAAIEDNRREMITSLTHDIKTPVTSICAYAESLRDGIAQTPETQQRYVETILEKAHLVNSLVNDLFVFSKLETCQESLDLEEVNAAEFLRSVFGEASKNDAYSLTYEPSDLENETLMINDVAFTRVIQNITQNSINHAAAERVMIRVSANKQGYNVIIRITDNGIGIDEEACEHVFDRFYRADRSRSSSGSGLGLSICMHLISGMNGKIWARSRKSEGFTICISLPLVNDR